LVRLDSLHSPGKGKAIRQFESGADRDLENGKLDFEGCLSPQVLEAFADYMHHKAIRNDGTKRSSDNWMKGIPRDSYMRSMWRHFHDVWMIHRGHGEERPDILEALMALLFNVQGMAYEIIKERDNASRGQ